MINNDTQIYHQIAVGAHFWPRNNDKLRICHTGPHLAFCNLEKKHHRSASRPHRPANQKQDFKKQVESKFIMSRVILIENHYFEAKNELPLQSNDKFGYHYLSLFIIIYHQTAVLEPFFQKHASHSSQGNISASFLKNMLATAARATFQDQPALNTDFLRNVRNVEKARLKPIKLGLS